MADTSITQLEAYTPASYDATADHQADVFVIVDTRDHTMAGSGSDKKLSISQFVTTSGGTQPCILDIAFAPVAQGDLIYRGAVDWAVLAPGTSGYILATQGASANPVWRSQSAVLDGIGSTQGDILYRGASAWGGLAPGTSGYVLATQGASANPSWASQSTVLDGIGSTQGDILYRGASTWGALAPGTENYVLASGGASANPSWVAPPYVSTQTANYVMAGPTTGSPAAPTFRALGGTDLPATGLTVTQWVGGITSISGTTSVAINCANTNAFHVALATTGVHTFTVSNLKIGQTVKITTIQGASPGDSTITWAGQTIRWAGGTAGQATATASQGDMFVVYGVSGASPPTADVIAGSVALANF